MPNSYAPEKRPLCPVCGIGQIKSVGSTRCADCRYRPGWHLGAPPTAEPSPPPPALKDRILAVLRKAPTTQPLLALACDATEGQVLDAIHAMQATGANLHLFGAAWSLERAPEAGSLTVDAYRSRANGTYKFGWLGDTHLCSKYARLDVLRDIYRRFANADIDRIFHAGNYIDGEARFNKFDLLVHGMDAQVRYLRDEYPVAPNGLITYAVDGDDHEGWYCFPATTRVTTDHGQRMICRVAVGDRVLTHEGRFRPVTQVFKRRVTESLVTLRYGRQKSSHRVTATANHPVFVKREGTWDFRPFTEVRVGDRVATTAAWCAKCAIRIPWWLQYCAQCWPDQPIESLRAARGGFQRSRTQEVGSLEKHLIEDILPVCRQLREEGWQPVPVGGRITPDIIAFKDGRVVAIEVEHEQGSMLAFKQAKYDGDPIHDYVDAIEWRSCRRQALKTRPYVSDYELDDALASDFVSVLVTGVTVGVPRTLDVFNLEVEAAHTYVAGHLLVHNCQREGVDIGRYVENAMKEGGRNDWRGLGYMEAFVPLEHAVTGKTTQLHLVHPGGGSAYATSYTVQKLVESYSGGSKPAVLLAGHYHKLEFINIRNVWTIQTGCTQDQTPFARKKRLHYALGAGLCELEQDAETGAIIGCTVQMWCYFDKGYYNNRWSLSGAVVLPDRGVMV